MNPSRTLLNRSDILTNGSFVILGGGLAGLTSAYYLSKGLPAGSQAKITLLERSDRFGGWVHSPNVGRDERCVFEGGPRSVRPKGLSGLMTLDLVKDLGLLDALISIPTTHPSAKNRYIYTPHGLQKLPSSIASLISSIFRSPISALPAAVFKDLTSGPGSGTLEDESVKSFITRRFGPRIGDELISGMVHGIYASDYGTLSARSSVFGPLWELERRHGSVIKGLLAKKAPSDAVVANEELISRLSSSLPPEVRTASVWGLKNGLETLTKKMTEWLIGRPNVELRKDEPMCLPCVRRSKSQITTPAHQHTADFVISAIPPRALHDSLHHDFKNQIASLGHNPAVTVAVVNVAYRSKRRIIPVPPAFGYLIPASIGPDINPHRVLGVVFDSDMMPGVESTTSRGHTEDLTKLTVMLGGHFYSDLPIPSLDVLKHQALEALEQQLEINEKPLYINATLQRDCIPQYLVGHHRRMSGLHHALQGRGLALVGSGYGGVGVNDVVKGCRETVELILKAGSATGLESFN
ncbi:uncharacterized protein MELLADRAFT_42777 [Melampsora larici-populina 98AG31]|uniref:Protoporphyrinogen oxidase n=1 Tax=Melampsora larici-populina (strain 98AG31 / pathotype 3-4-7) TaxID=747676 RepID=F4RFQ5_MELLP|nr:uncharacterized protein MELLADRAFT_42777 [Melampsora larici-populina 98AG31]EGG08851.1 hypothetical protein MELLADRAFT_42777 [Melampsora larici-populina 98AG31]